MACPLPVDMENSFSLCRNLLHIWGLLSHFPEDFCSLHWTTAFHLLFSHVHFIFKLNDMCVADSASWDPFQPSTIFLCSVCCWGPLGSLHWVWDQYYSWGLCCLRKAAGLFHVPGAWHFCLYNHGFFSKILLVHACNFVYHFPTSCAFPTWNFI